MLVDNKPPRLPPTAAAAAPASCRDPDPSFHSAHVLGLKLLFDAKREHEA